MKKRTTFFNQKSFLAQFMLSSVSSEVSFVLTLGANESYHLFCNSKQRVYGVVCNKGGDISLVKASDMSKTEYDGKDITVKENIGSLNAGSHKTAITFPGTAFELKVPSPSTVTSLSKTEHELIWTDQGSSYFRLTDPMFKNVYSQFQEKFQLFNIEWVSGPEKNVLAFKEFFIAQLCEISGEKWYDLYASGTLSSVLLLTASATSMKDAFDGDSQKEQELSKIRQAMGVAVDDFRLVSSDLSGVYDPNASITSKGIERNDKAVAMPNNDESMAHLLSELLDDHPWILEAQTTSIEDSLRALNKILQSQSIDECKKAFQLQPAYNIAFKKFCDFMSLENLKLRFVSPNADYKRVINQCKDFCEILCACLLIWKVDPSADIGEEYNKFQYLRSVLHITDDAADGVSAEAIAGIKSRIRSRQEILDILSMIPSYNEEGFKKWINKLEIIYEQSPTFTPDPNKPKLPINPNAYGLQSTNVMFSFMTHYDRRQDEAIKQAQESLSQAFERICKIQVAEKASTQGGFNPTFTALANTSISQDDIKRLYAKGLTKQAEDFEAQRAEYAGELVKRINKERKSGDNLEPILKRAYERQREKRITEAFGLAWNEETRSAPALYLDDFNARKGQVAALKDLNDENDKVKPKTSIPNLSNSEASGQSVVATLEALKGLRPGYDNVFYIPSHDEFKEKFIEEFVINKDAMEGFNADLSKERIQTVCALTKQAYPEIYVGSLSMSYNIDDLDNLITSALFILCEECAIPSIPPTAAPSAPTATTAEPIINLFRKYFTEYLRNDSDRGWSSFIVLARQFMLDFNHTARQYTVSKSYIKKSYLEAKIIMRIARLEVHRRNKKLQSDALSKDYFFDIVDISQGICDVMSCCASYGDFQSGLKESSAFFTSMQTLDFVCNNALEETTKSTIDEMSKKACEVEVEALYAKSREVFAKYSSAIFLKYLKLQHSLSHEGFEQKFARFIDAMDEMLKIKVETINAILDALSAQNSLNNELRNSEEETMYSSYTQAKTLSEALSMFNKQIKADNGNPCMAFTRSESLQAYEFFYEEINKQLMNPNKTTQGILETFLILCYQGLEQDQSSYLLSKRLPVELFMSEYETDLRARTDYVWNHRRHPKLLTIPETASTELKSDKEDDVEIEYSTAIGYLGALAQQLTAPSTDEEKSIIQRKELFANMLRILEEQEKYMLSLKDIETDIKASDDLIHHLLEKGKNNSMELTALIAKLDDIKPRIKTIQDSAQSIAKVLWNFKGQNVNVSDFYDPIYSCAARIQIICKLYFEYFDSFVDSKANLKKCKLIFDVIKQFAEIIKAIKPVNYHLSIVETEVHNMLANFQKNTPTEDEVKNKTKLLDVASNKQMSYQLYLMNGCNNQQSDDTEYHLAYDCDGISEISETDRRDMVNRILDSNSDTNKSIIRARLMNFPQSYLRYVEYIDYERDKFDIPDNDEALALEMIYGSLDDAYKQAVIIGSMAGFMLKQKEFNEKFAGIMESRNQSKINAKQIHEMIQLRCYFIRKLNHQLTFQEYSDADRPLDQQQALLNKLAVVSNTVGAKTRLILKNHIEQLIFDASIPQNLVETKIALLGSVTKKAAIECSAIESFEAKPDLDAADLESCLALYENIFASKIYEPEALKSDIDLISKDKINISCADRVHNGFMHVMQYSMIFDKNTFVDKVMALILEQDDPLKIMAMKAAMYFYCSVAENDQYEALYELIMNYLNAFGDDTAMVIAKHEIQAYLYNIAFTKSQCQAMLPKLQQPGWKGDFAALKIHNLPFCTTDENKRLIDIQDKMRLIDIQDKMPVDLNQKDQAIILQSLDTIIFRIKASYKYFYHELNIPMVDGKPINYDKSYPSQELKMVEELIAVHTSEIAGQTFITLSYEQAFRAAFTVNSLMPNLASEMQVLNAIIRSAGNKGSVVGAFFGAKVGSDPGKALHDLFSTPWFFKAKTIVISIITSMVPFAMIGVVQTFLNGCGNDLDSFVKNMDSLKNSLKIMYSDQSHQKHIDAIFNTILGIMTPLLSMQQYNRSDITNAVLSMILDFNRLSFLTFQRRLLMQGQASGDQTMSVYKSAVSNFPPIISFLIAHSTKHDDFKQKLIGSIDSYIDQGKANIENGVGAVLSGWESDLLLKILNIDMPHDMDDQLICTLIAILFNVFADKDIYKYDFKEHNFKTFAMRMFQKNLHAYYQGRFDVPAIENKKANFLPHDIALSYRVGDDTFEENLTSHFRQFQSEGPKPVGVGAHEWVVKAQQDATPEAPNYDKMHFGLENSLNDSIDIIYNALKELIEKLPNPQKLSEYDLIHDFLLQSVLFFESLQGEPLGGSVYKLEELEKAMLLMRSLHSLEGLLPIDEYTLMLLKENGNAFFAQYPAAGMVVRFGEEISFLAQIAKIALRIWEHPYFATINQIKNPAKEQRIFRIYIGSVLEAMPHPKFMPVDKLAWIFTHKSDFIMELSKIFQNASFPKWWHSIQSMIPAIVSGATAHHLLQEFKIGALDGKFKIEKSDKMFEVRVAGGMLCMQSSKSMGINEYYPKRQSMQFAQKFRNTLGKTLKLTIEPNPKWEEISSSVSIRILKCLEEDNGEKLLHELELQREGKITTVVIHEKTLRKLREPHVYGDFEDDLKTCQIGSLKQHPSIGYKVRVDIASFAHLRGEGKNPQEFQSEMKEVFDGKSVFLHPFLIELLLEKRSEEMSFVLDCIQRNGYHKSDGFLKAGLQRTVNAHFNCYEAYATIWNLKCDLKPENLKDLINKIQSDIAELNKIILELEASLNPMAKLIGFQQFLNLTAVVNKKDAILNILKSLYISFDKWEIFLDSQYNRNLYQKDIIAGMVHKLSQFIVFFHSSVSTALFIIPNRNMKFFPIEELKRVTEYAELCASCNFTQNVCDSILSLNWIQMENGIKLPASAFFDDDLRKKALEILRNPKKHQISYSQASQETGITPANLNKDPDVSVPEAYYMRQGIKDLKATLHNVQSHCILLQLFYIQFKKVESLEALFGNPLKTAQELASVTRSIKAILLLHSLHKSGNYKEPASGNLQPLIYMDKIVVALPLNLDEHYQNARRFFVEHIVEACIEKDKTTTMSDVDLFEEFKSLIRQCSSDKSSVGLNKSEKQLLRDVYPLLENFQPKGIRELLDLLQSNLKDVKNHSKPIELKYESKTSDDLEESIYQALRGRTDPPKRDVIRSFLIMITKARKPSDFETLIAKTFFDYSFERPLLATREAHQHQAFIDEIDRYINKSNIDKRGYIKMQWGYIISTIVAPEFIEKNIGRSSEIHQQVLELKKVYDSLLERMDPEKCQKKQDLNPSSTMLRGSISGVVSEARKAADMKPKFEVELGVKMQSPSMGALDLVNSCSELVRFSLPHVSPDDMKAIIRASFATSLSEPCVVDPGCPPIAKEKWQTLTNLVNALEKSSNSHDIASVLQKEINQCLECGKIEEAASLKIHFDIINAVNASTKSQDDKGCEKYQKLVQTLKEDKGTENMVWLKSMFSNGMNFLTSSFSYFMPKSLINSAKSSLKLVFDVGKSNKKQDFKRLLVARLFQVSDIMPCTTESGERFTAELLIHRVEQGFQFDTEEIVNVSALINKIFNTISEKMETKPAQWMPAIHKLAKLNQSDQLDETVMHTINISPKGRLLDIIEALYINKNELIKKQVTHLNQLLKAVEFTMITFHSDYSFHDFICDAMQVAERLKALFSLNDEQVNLPLEQILNMCRNAEVPLMLSSHTQLIIRILTMKAHYDYLEANSYEVDKLFLIPTQSNESLMHEGILKLFIPFEGPLNQDIIKRHCAKSYNPYLLKLEEIREKVMVFQGEGLFQQFCSCFKPYADVEVDSNVLFNKFKEIASMLCGVINAARSTPRDDFSFNFDTASPELIKKLQDSVRQFCDPMYQFPEINSIVHILIALIYPLGRDTCDMDEKERLEKELLCMIKNDRCPLYDEMMQLRKSVELQFYFTYLTKIAERFECTSNKSLLTKCVWAFLKKRISLLDRADEQDVKRLEYSKIANDPSKSFTFDDFSMQKFLFRAWISIGYDSSWEGWTKERQYQPSSMLSPEIVSQLRLEKRPNVSLHGAFGLNVAKKAVEGTMLRGLSPLLAPSIVACLDDYGESARLGKLYEDTVKRIHDYEPQDDLDPNSVVPAITFKIVCNIPEYKSVGPNFVDPNATAKESYSKQRMLGEGVGVQSCKGPMQYTSNAKRGPCFYSQDVQSKKARIFQWNIKYIFMFVIFSIMAIMLFITPICNQLLKEEARKSTGISLPPSWKFFLKRGGNK